MKLHFIAIGGAAMHSLAISLSRSGHTVTGSDDELFNPARDRLEMEGLLPSKPGWHPDKIHLDLDAVILGMHARADNPELIKAKELGLKIYSFPEFLFSETKHKKRVVISGSHGKTTITSMVMHVMKHENLEFDYLVGSALEGFDNMASILTQNEVAVFEGDEYLSSCLDRRPKFHLYKPSLALISGISWDHINVFPDFEDYVNQFRIFIKTMDPGSTLVYCEEDELLKQLVEGAGRHLKLIPYKVHNYRLADGETLLIHKNGETLVRVFGRHNMQNIEGARLLCRELGISDCSFYDAISVFGGPAKRLQLLKESFSVAVYSDFAHSPSKVEATINAVREKYPEREIIACLELHTFSSMNKLFLGHYKKTMRGAGVAGIYYNPVAVKHKNLELMSHEDILQAFGHDNMRIFTVGEKLREFLIKMKKADSVILFMSSGNFSGLDIKSLAAELTEE